LERADALLDALMDERIPQVTKAKIQEWFKSDMSKDAKYIALKKLFVDLKPNLDHDRYEYEQFAKIGEILGFNDASAKPVMKRKPGLRGYAMRFAAVLIPAFVIAGVVYLWVERAGNAAGQYPVANMSVSASVDGQKRIVLPDGSQVWINSESEISYNDDFSKTRFVSLTGEAFFSVVRDTVLPFQVKADGLVVEVLGTEFNIRAYAGETTEQVILTSGSVRITTPNKKKIVLEPNQRLTFDQQSLKAVVDQVRGDTISQWRLRRLRFVDTPLEQAFEDISTYYGRDLVIDGWRPTDDLVNIPLENELPIEQVMAAIRNITGTFAYEITDTQIIIKPGI